MMKRIPLAVALGAVLVLTIGCHRYIDSSNPVRSLPSAPPTPINVAALLNDQSVTLNWEVGDSTDVSRFRVYVADSAGTDYVLRDSTTTYSKTITGLIVNKLYNFEVATVGSDGIEGNRSTPLSVRIGLMAITIENGNLYTNHRDVTLQLVAPSTATYVYLSEDSTFTGTAPSAFFPTHTFTLSPNDGLKTVFARFVFSDGSQSGTPVSDQITLDTRAKIDSVYFTSAATPPFKAGDVITFLLSAGGETGGVASAGITGAGTPAALYDDGSNGDAV
ncbi:MAG TPA: fibronectin type III domain-containing protein, partial [Candidatus Acidoferrum sp.]|nr:fibronectin type III domain-containing protein [Candidatus Acidoferrum sp.]